MDYAVKKSTQSSQAVTSASAHDQPDALQWMDHRPAANSQAMWQAAATNSPQSQRLIQLSTLANRFSTRRQVVQRNGLDDVAAPKVWQMTAEQIEVQASIMRTLNQLIQDSVGPSTQPHDVYRICAFRLEKLQDGRIQFNPERPGLVPAGIADGSHLLTSLDFVNTIGANVMHTMQGSGQLGYVEDRILGNPDWDVVVDVDFYYERPANHVGFHKDTIGRSLFVNLNFNNSADIMGPEYVLNPPPIHEHDQHIEPRLPPEFIEDLIDQRRKLPRPNSIEATRVPASGVVSFVDELVHHSTPYQQHRGLSSEEFEDRILRSPFADRYRKVRRAIRFTALVNNTLAAKVNAREQLLSLELEDRHVDYLLQGADSISTGQIRDRLNGNPEYEEMKALPTHEPYMRALYQMMKDNFFITIEMMELSRMPGDIIHELFRDKPDLRNVSLAGCDADCDRDAHNQTYPIMPGPFAPRLRRAMSGILQRGQLPPPVQEKRQFFRTWVQAVPKAQSSVSQMHDGTL